MLTSYCGRFSASLGLLFCALTSCNTITEVIPKASENEPTHVVYTIPQGAHYSDKNTYKEVQTKHLRFEVVFDSTAIYQSKIVNNQADINKLWGISDCNTSHHTNSARFGWRWFNNRLELLAYTYLEKKWEYKLLDTVAVGEAITCELKLEDLNYTFILNGKETPMPRACNGIATGYQLYPYFGGDETAPHNITIRIKEQL